jgi:hypothetical protein
MSQITVKQILKEIDSLDDQDRARLESAMSRRLNLQWKSETTQARATARRRRVDQKTIDQAIQRRRYGE